MNVDVYYFYHAVPEKMMGRELMPLSVVLVKDSELYKKYAGKYEDRQEVAKQRIPILNCSWSDVVQMIPLHPQKVYDAQLETGIDQPNLPSKYFKIPANLLDPAKTGLFFKTAPGEEHKDYKLLTDVDLVTLQEVPPSTLVYFKMCAEFKMEPFNFQFIPHVFYKGTIDISNLEILKINTK